MIRADALSKGDTPPSRHKPGKAEPSPNARTGYRNARRYLYIYTVSKKEREEVSIRNGERAACTKRTRNDARKGTHQAMF
ncbi:hypothetical protein JCM10599A_20400 [Paraburkholderia kururiensis]